MKPWVTHVLEKYATTGENYVFEQLLLPKRHESSLVAEIDLASAVQPLARERVRSFRAQYSSPFLEKVVRGLSTRVLEGPYLQAFNRLIRKEMHQRKARLLHAHFGMMGYKCLEAAQDAPMVVTFYGVDVSHGVVSPFWRPRLQKMFPKAAKVIVLCEEAEERLEKIGCPKEKIRLWDIGIPLAEYPYRAPLLKKPEEGVRFLIVARFVEKKGHAFLLPAFRRLVDRHPQSTLTLMGNGPLKAALQEKIRALGLEKNVELLDTQGQKDFFPRFQKALREHDVFVLPSVVAKDGDDEGGPPVVITNAMAAGLPVISTNVGGIPRAIDDGLSGLLTKAGDVEDLFQKLLWVSEHSQDWARLSQAARKKVEDRFALQRQIDQLEGIYEEVLWKKT